jgi:prophage regulatory protein
MADSGNAQDRLIREPECQRMTGLGRTKRWQLERAGLFPKRRVISGHITGYLESELLEWIRSRPVSEYRAPEAPSRARGIAPAA